MTFYCKFDALLKLSSEVKTLETALQKLLKKPFLM